MIHIRHFTKSDTPCWDRFVLSRAGANVYQLAGWKSVVEKTYGHTAHYLMATRTARDPRSERPGNGPNGAFGPKKTSVAVMDSPEPETVSGILPMVHMKHRFFGNRLISMPYFDTGGILAEDPESETALLEKAVSIAESLKADSIQLRHGAPMLTKAALTADGRGRLPAGNGFDNILPMQQEKRLMVIELPDSAERLMKSFKSKLRSQIKRPVKAGLTAKRGGAELLKDFYRVLAVNMRDLGSPVHSRKLMENVLKAFPETCRIIVVYHQQDPVAASLVVGFRERLENPWASALRSYGRLSPNMLLYWEMLSYACERGCRFFNFGRSTQGGGTFRFKKQWGAKPFPLHWYHIPRQSGRIDDRLPDKSRFSRAIRYWMGMPVLVTRILGPPIRKHIDL